LHFLNTLAILWAMSDNNKNLIDNIKQTEEKAEDIINSAKEEAKKNLANFNSQKEIELKQKTEKAQKVSEEYIEKARVEINKELVEVKSQAKQEMERIKEKAKQKTDEAVEFAVKELIK